MRKHNMNRITTRKNIMTKLYKKFRALLVIIFLAGEAPHALSTGGDNLNEHVKIDVTYDRKNCSWLSPLNVIIKNESARSVLNTSFEIYAFVPGHSSNVVEGDGHRYEDRILKPGELYNKCHVAPSLKRGDDETVNWVAVTNRVTAALRKPEAENKQKNQAIINQLSFMAMFVGSCDTIDKLILIKEREGITDGNKLIRLYIEQSAKSLNWTPSKLFTQCEKARTDLKIIYKEYVPPIP